MSIKSVDVGGIMIPRIAHGSGTVFYKGPDANKTEEYDMAIVQNTIDALKSGFVFLDAAEVYGNEKDVGKGLKDYLAQSGKQRSDVIVCSKVNGSVDEEDLGLGKILSRLGVEYLDIFLLHQPFNIIDKKATWKKMETLREKKLARLIGVSNFRVADLESFIGEAKIKPFINQIEHHPYLQNDDICTYCRKHGIVLMGYGSIVPITKASDGPLAAVLKDIEIRTKLSQGMILLRWALQHENGMDIVATTTRQVERMKEYLTVFEVSLSDDDVKKLTEVGKTFFFRAYWKTSPW